MSDIQEEQKRLYKRAEENDKENLQYISIEEALYQIQQRIKMHELEQTTSVENEREKVILNYINKLQDKINKAIEYINKYCEDYVVEDSPDPMCLFYGDDGTYKPEAKQELLEILKGKEK